ncbi:MAG: M28 family peptidase [Bacteroidia bacterium]|nr:M28 family peptidase [Bacteroidia bacterium]
MNTTLFLKSRLAAVVLAGTLFLFSNLHAQNKEDSLFIRQIFDAALTKGDCYRVLEHLCTQIGPRLSGSKGAEDAVVYTRSVMEDYGFDKVFLQDVMVPHWERGNISKASFVSGKQKHNLQICALGSSIATPAAGISGKVIEVKNFDELEKLGTEKVKDKIVFFNRPFDDRHIHTFRAYGGAVDQRGSGASKASKLGAVAVIVRSMTHLIDDFPHAGNMHYDPQYPKIPAAAVSTKGAELLSEILKKDPELLLTYTINCTTHPDAPSHNVVGQLNGNTNPDEYIVVGGHLDAWDLAQGAHDDGAGCVQSMEALRLLQMLGYKPKHSLRAVMFMNEENGLRGGLKYAELAKEKGEVHRFAIESDRGGFTPRGFSIDHGGDTLAFFQRFSKLIAPYGLTDLVQGGSGADIGPLRKHGTICVGYIPDSQRYFDYHHAGNDNFDAINKRELEMGAASMAVLIYLADKYWQ